MRTSVRSEGWTGQPPRHVERMSIQRVGTILAVNSGGESGAEAAPTAIPAAMRTATTCMPSAYSGAVEVGSTTALRAGSRSLRSERARTLGPAPQRALAPPCRPDPVRAGLAPRTHRAARRRSDLASVPDRPRPGGLLLRRG